MFWYTPYLTTIAFHQPVLEALTVCGRSGRMLKHPVRNDYRIYSVIPKDGLNIVHRIFLNYIWYRIGLHTIWKRRSSSFKYYVDHSYTIYSSGKRGVWNLFHLFESPFTYVYICVSISTQQYFTQCELRVKIKSVLSPNTL